MPLIPGGGRKRRRGPFVPPAGGQSFITASDFTFLGGFRAPNLYPLNEQGKTYGLTHRYKNGNFRLMSMSKGDNASNGSVVHLFEYAVPALQMATGSYQNATVTTNFGTNVWSGLHVADRLATGSCYWDEPTNQLFWFGQTSYHSSSTENIIGIATLDDDTPDNSTSRGRYRLNNLGVKATKGALAIPPAFHSALGGKRLGIGFGGYESNVASAGVSMGPALAAVDPAIFDGAADNSSVAGAEVLVSHTWGSHSQYTSPSRGIRLPDTLATDGTGGVSGPWDPMNGFGYFGAMDRILQGMVWIDTPTKKGVLLFCPQSGNGDNATIATSTFVSASGTGDNSLHTFDITLSQPLESANTTWLLFVQNTTGGFNRSTVSSVSPDKTALRVVLTSHQQQQGGVPGSNPVVLVGGRVFYGSSYFSSVIYSSINTSRMFCYDPADVVGKNTDPLPFVSCEDHVGPRGELTNTSADRLITNGVTFDTTTNLLYLLQADGFIGVYQLAS